MQLLMRGEVVLVCANKIPSRRKRLSCMNLSQFGAILQLLCAKRCYAHRVRMHNKFSLSSAGRSAFLDRQPTVLESRYAFAPESVGDCISSSVTK
jgi:hypothetical protein